MIARYARLVWIDARLVWIARDRMAKAIEQAASRNGRGFRPTHEIMACALAADG